MCPMSWSEDCVHLNVAKLKKSEQLLMDKDGNKVSDRSGQVQYYNTPSVVLQMYVLPRILQYNCLPYPQCSITIFFLSLIQYYRCSFYPSCTSTLVCSIPYVVLQMYSYPSCTITDMCLKPHAVLQMQFLPLT